MRPRPVVVLNPDSQHALKMPTIEDQEPIETFPPGRANLALHVRIRSGRRDRSLDHGHPVGFEHKVRPTAVLVIVIAAWCADAVPDPRVKFPAHIPGLLGHPPRFIRRPRPRRHNTSEPPPSSRDHGDALWFKSRVLLTRRSRRRHANERSKGDATTLCGGERRSEPWSGGPGFEPGASRSPTGAETCPRVSPQLLACPPVLDCRRRGVLL